jgi:glycosyltransferase involved in cell wall biosynthesis
MRVVIEATPLSLSSGGLLRYTTELSLALARCFPNDEYILVSDQPFAMPQGAPLNLNRGGGPRNTAERRWWLWGLTRESARLGADVVHGPDFAVPYLPRRPSVLTLHDMSPWMQEGWRTANARVRHRTPVLLELGIATMVVTPTEGVRKQAIERFRLRPERVVAIAEAAASWLHPVKPVAAVSRYFLYVGALEARKNIGSLIEAWRTIHREHAVDLIVAGRPRPDFPPIAEEPGLHVTGEVPDAALAQLYSGALAFVYPSLYEGFGLPVLEAMQCGAVVIASRAVSEVAGDAALYAGTTDELIQAMRRMLLNPEAAVELRARSLARAKEFTWERAAQQTHEVYLESRRRFGT